MTQEDAAPDLQDSSPDVSSRSPTASLIMMIITQLQFLATLSLVDYVIVEAPWLFDFVSGLR